jgi:hypothetical protein
MAKPLRMSTEGGRTAVNVRSYWHRWANARIGTIIPEHVMRFGLTDAGNHRTQRFHQGSKIPSM